MLIRGGVGRPSGHGAGDGVEARVSRLGAPVAGLFIDSRLALDDIDAGLVAGPGESDIPLLEPAGVGRVVAAVPWVAPCAR